ncbi:MAG: Re/Si-specific NAD(P)(+) transhydrogenase subunit alpha [Alphaproteobacteria bacterium]
MKIAVLKERRADERRVAASPETVKKFIGLGATVAVETGAGAAAGMIDAAYAEAGAAIAATARAAADGADIVLKVRAPLAKGEEGAAEDELGLLPNGAVLVALLNPYADAARVGAYAAAGVTAFSLELLPRITRAQSMDVLSSQANLAGYKAVLEAANHAKAFPLMMTAAGTVPPARVFILGAGVAGLQAIATAKRLGAVVSATDVRPAAREQVQSLGGTFVMVDNEESRQAETAGGYAKEMSEDYKRQQAALVRETLKKQDIAITTALIPGRRAPVLITADMVAEMKPGAIIVDLAVEQGGNVEGSRPGEVVDTANGVSIIGYTNMPGRIASDASALYARNLLNFLTPLIDREKGALAIDLDDEIVAATCLSRDHEVVHQAFRAAAAAAAPTPAPAAPAPTASPGQVAKETPAGEAAKGGAVAEPGTAAKPKPAAKKAPTTKAAAKPAQKTPARKAAPKKNEAKTAPTGAVAADATIAPAQPEPSPGQDDKANGAGGGAKTEG